MTGYRAGAAVHGGRAVAALLDFAGAVVTTADVGVSVGVPPSVSLTVALDSLLERAAQAGVTVGQIEQVMLALPDPDFTADGYLDIDHERWPSGLGRVAVVRLGAATTALPPLALWPLGLRARISAGEASLTGGAMLDGGEFEPLDRDRLVGFARGIAGRVSAVAISAVLSSVTSAHELLAASVLREELGTAVPILLSHEFGGLGLVERENTTVLQAALTAPAVEEAAAVLDALTERGLGEAEIFLARGDGTIATLDYATTHPLLLRGGVDAAVVRGAGLLAAETDAVVALADPGSASRSVCALVEGAPRVVSGRTVLAGVTVGSRRAATVPIGPVDDVMDLYEAIDRAKGVSDDLPLLLAGPGARELAKGLPDSVPGTVRVSCPPGAEAAAAVGAAAAPVSAEARRIIALNDRDADAVRCRVRDAACAAAMRSGADPATVRVTEVDEEPIACLSEPAVLLRVRAEGPPRVGWLSGRRGTRRRGRPGGARQEAGPVRDVGEETRR